MMPIRRLAALVALASLGVAPLACSSGDDAASDTADAADTAAAQATDQPAPASATASMDTVPTVEDVERFERSLQAQIKAVQDAKERKRQAKTSEDTLSAMMISMQLDSIGAAAAGGDAQRWRLIESRLEGALAAVNPMPLVDTTKMSKAERDQARPTLEAMRQQQQAGAARALEGIPPDVVEALRTRADALSKLNLQLAGELMSVAQ